MDKSSVIYLISKTYVKDALAQMVPQEVRRKVFCEKQSVGQSEFFAAGNAGFKAEYQLTMFGPDYHGEPEAEVDGEIYSIYRTYRRKNDDIELYLRKPVGRNG